MMGEEEEEDEEMWLTDWIAGAGRFLEEYFVRGSGCDR